MTSAGKPVVKVRSGRGEVMRAEFLGQEGDKVHIRYLKEVDGRTPESWIHVKRIIGELPGGQVDSES